MSMTSYVGLYKQLGQNEQRIFENSSLNPVIFKKRIRVKKMIGHETRDFAVSSLMVSIYLTNRRLLFLIIRENGTAALRKRGVPTLSGLESSWYEIPVSSIRNVEALNMQVSKNKELKELAPSVTNQERVSIVEIDYEGNRTSGNLKEYMESMFDAPRLAKMYNLKEAVELGSKLQIIGEQNMNLIPKLKGIIVTE